MVANGASLPPVGPLLALLAVAAVCANREALFSSELAATAESSVVLCAVVVFHADAPLLGPLLLGLATGWLDSYHWASRSFVRMSFNSGNRALGALAAAARVPERVECAGFIDVDARGSCGRSRRWCSSWSTPHSSPHSSWCATVKRGAARRATSPGSTHLSLPLALYGGAAGLLAIEVNVWLGVLAVTPAAWVPETFLVPARSGRMCTRAPRVVAVAVIATVAVAAGAVLGTVDLAAAAFVVGLGVLFGVELTVDRRFVIPPVLAAGLALALVVERSCRRRGRRGPVRGHRGRGVVGAHPEPTARHGHRGDRDHRHWRARQACSLDTAVRSALAIGAFVGVASAAGLARVRAVRFRWWGGPCRSW